MANAKRATHIFAVLHISDQVLCRDMCTDMCVDMCTDVCIDMCMDICLDMCIDMCRDMCTDVCIDMCMDICLDMCIDMCRDMCIDLCVDMCMDMCIDMCRGMCIDMCTDVFAVLHISDQVPFNQFYAFEVEHEPITYTTACACCICADRHRCARGGIRLSGWNALSGTHWGPN